MANITGSRPDHDIEPGFLRACQVCGSTNLELVIDLGHQPLCDSMLTTSQLNEPEINYPLRQVWCRNCTLSQLDYIVQGAVVFHPDYPYRTGVTRELADYLVDIAADLIPSLSIAPDSLIVDIGSNDGTLLSGFKSRGMRVLGIEPTNIARFAREDGIETLQEFFTEGLARQIVAQYGRAALATATNVFAHVASMGEFIRGLEVLLSDDGVFMLENHYLLNIMQSGQFDTIYHEHLRSYSLCSLVTLFDYYDFTVVDAQQVSRYAGSIRVLVAKGKGRRVSQSVAQLLAEEEKYGLSDSEAYTRFREKSLKAAQSLASLALDAKEKGASFVGNSCPGRCSTLLNFAGIGPDLMPYIAEQPTSLKLGLHLPGKHIPVVQNDILLRDQPDYVVLLAWHYADSIAQQLRDRGLRSRLVIPLPEVRILD